MEQTDMTDAELHVPLWRKVAAVVIHVNGLMLCMGVIVGLLTYGLPN